MTYDKYNFFDTVVIFIVTHPLATGHPSSPVLYWLGWSFDPKNCKKHWKKIYDTYLAFSCLCPQCSQVVSGNQLNPPSIQEKMIMLPDRQPPYHMDSLSNTTFFTKFKPQRYITTPRSWKQNCLKYSDHEASPKLAKRIQQIPWNQKKWPLQICQICPDQRARGQANEAWVPYKIALARGRLRRQPRLSPSG